MQLLQKPNTRLVVTMLLALAADSSSANAQTVKNMALKNDYKCVATVSVFNMPPWIPDYNVNVEVIHVDDAGRGINHLGYSSMNYADEATAINQANQAITSICNDHRHPNPNITTSLKCTSLSVRLLLSLPPTYSDTRQFYYCPESL